MSNLLERYCVHVIGLIFGLIALGFVAYGVQQATKLNPLRIYTTISRI